MQNLKLLIYLSSLFWPGMILSSLNLSFHKCRASAQMQHSEIWSDKKSPPPVNLSVVRNRLLAKTAPSTNIVGQFNIDVSCENQPSVSSPIIIHLPRRASNLPTLFTFRLELTPDCMQRSSSTTMQARETTSVSIVTPTSGYTGIKLYLATERSFVIIQITLSWREGGSSH